MRMSYARTIRWLRTWLVGLFALAQIAGVSPLIYEHTLNVFDAAQTGVDHGHVSPAVLMPIIITASWTCMINAAPFTRWRVLCRTSPMSRSPFA
jgi:hypothetical protein